MSNIVDFPKILRGMNESDFIKNSRDQIRHSIDLAKEIPRISTHSLPKFKDLTHTALYKGLINTGYDVRNLVQSTREKLQTNKARNSDFNPSERMK
jgi:hypothetical protein